MIKHQPLMSLAQPSTSPTYISSFHLPPKEIALSYLSIAFDQTQPLFQFIHMPSFYARLEEFYQARDFCTNGPTLDDTRFEALLSQLLALGQLFSGGDKA
jgi:hypothetical protein